MTPADAALAMDLELFQGCAPDMVRDMLAGLRQLNLEAGMLFDVSATDASCCVLTRGRLAVEFTGSTGHPRVIGLVEEGELLVRPGAQLALSIHSCHAPHAASGRCHGRLSAEFPPGAACHGAVLHRATRGRRVTRSEH